MKNTRVFILSVFLLFLFSCSTSKKIFYEDFNDKNIDTSKWNIVNQKWGESPNENLHGGVIPENVFIDNGKLVIRALGEQYVGKLTGHGRNTRVGGAIHSKKNFGGGSFEVHAKICPHPGALSAFWTYYYENDDFNHEIDFEFPGRNQSPFKSSDSDITWGLMTNWRGVKDHQRSTADKFFGFQNDGEYHLYRFDWYPDEHGNSAKIEWYYDGKLMHVEQSHVPSHVAPFWLGIWFPKWIANADFDIEYMYIDWVRIKEF